MVLFLVETEPMNQRQYQSSQAQIELADETTEQGCENQRRVLRYQTLRLSDNAVALAPTKHGCTYDSCLTQLIRTI